MAIKIILVTYSDGLDPSRTAISSYSFLFSATKFGKPRAQSCEAATLDANVSKGSVNTGVPAHNTSMPVDTQLLPSHLIKINSTGSFTTFITMYYCSHAWY